MEKNELIEELTNDYKILEYRIEHRDTINTRNFLIRKLMESAVFVEQLIPFLASAFIVVNSPLVKNNSSFNNNTYVENTISTEENTTEPIIHSNMIYNTIPKNNMIYNTTPEINELISKKEIIPLSKTEVVLLCFMGGIWISRINKMMLVPIMEDIKEKVNIKYRHIDISEYDAMKKTLEMKKKNLEMLAAMNQSRSLKKK